MSSVIIAKIPLGARIYCIIGFVERIAENSIESYVCFKKIFAPD